MAIFRSIEDTRERLRAVGYLPDTEIATIVFLADALQMPLLLEGPAGTGKTELAKAITACAEAELVRLQCYEGLDEARVLYEWNYRKQLLRIQAAQATTADADAAAGLWDSMHDDIFSEEFLLTRPLLTAITREGPTVLLVDEVDKTDVEVEGLLLELLSDFQVSIPEIGTIKAKQRPFVILTSNATRDLSEALKRRCLYAYIGYPTLERESEIVRVRVPEASTELAQQVVKAVRSMRNLDLRKPPSVAETIDWARAIIAMGHTSLNDEVADATLGVVLKHQHDRQRTREQLQLGGNK